MRKRRWFSALIFVMPAVLAVATFAVAGDDGGRQRFRFDNLTGYQEPPSISTTGTGTFEASLDGDVISYRLTYSALEGGNVLQAHIHFGQRSVNGGIIAFLCSNLGNGPAGTPVCPQPAAGATVTVEGTIEPADIVGPSAATGGQGIQPGSFAEAVRALRAGVVYANIHTTNWPGGEIRGQVIERGRQGDNDDD